MAGTWYAASGKVRSLVIIRKIKYVLKLARQCVAHGCPLGAITLIRSAPGCNTTTSMLQYYCKDWMSSAG